MQFRQPPTPIHLISQNTQFDGKIYFYFSNLLDTDKTIYLQREGKTPIKVSIVNHPNNFVAQYMNNLFEIQNIIGSRVTVKGYSTWMPYFTDYFTENSITSLRDFSGNLTLNYKHYNNPYSIDTGINSVGLKKNNTAWNLNIYPLVSLPVLSSQSLATESETQVIRMFDLSGSSYVSNSCAFNGIDNTGIDCNLESITFTNEANIAIDPIQRPLIDRIIDIATNNIEITTGDDYVLFDCSDNFNDMYGFNLIPIVRNYLITISVDNTVEGTINGLEDDTLRGIYRIVQITDVGRKVKLERFHFEWDPDTDMYKPCITHQFSPIVKLTSGTLTFKPVENEYFSSVISEVPTTSTLTASDSNYSTTTYNNLIGLLSNLNLSNVDTQTDFNLLSTSLLTTYGPRYKTYRQQSNWNKQGLIIKINKSNKIINKLWYYTKFIN